MVKIPTRVVRCSRDETLRAKNVSSQPGCGKFVPQRKIPRPKERGIGAGDRGRTGTVSPPPDFELFASYGIQTNSNPYGGRQRTPKSPQLLIILKLMC